jgi:osmotically-inducible protein OsmY
MPEHFSLPKIEQQGSRQKVVAHAPSEETTMANTRGYDFDDEQQNGGHPDDRRRQDRMTGGQGTGGSRGDQPRRDMQGNPSGIGDDLGRGGYSGRQRGWDDSENRQDNGNRAGGNPSGLWQSSQGDGGTDRQPGYGRDRSGESQGYGSGMQGGYGRGAQGDYRRDGSNDRGFFEKAGDEVSSWFGDSDAQRRREVDHRGKGPKGYARSDDRIKEEVSGKLSDDWMIDASDIEVEVADGEVTLTGQVDSRQTRRRAEDCVEGLAGVKHVQNNLRVKSQSGATSRGSGTATESSGGASGDTTGGGMTGAGSSGGVMPS